MRYTPKKFLVVLDTSTTKLQIEKRMDRNLRGPPSVNSDIKKLDLGFTEGRDNDGSKYHDL